MQRVQKKTLLIIYLLIFFQFFNLTLINSGTSIQEPNKNIKKISWEESIINKEQKIIPGSVQTDFGRFNFEWIIENSKNAKLVTKIPSGSAELPQIEKKLFPLLLENGSTLLFQEWYPLKNIKEPASLKLITTVSTSDLFLKLPSMKVSMRSPEIKKSSKINWGKISNKYNILYLEGKLKTDFGTLDIYWKKTKDSLPELITLDSPGAGELPAVESKLFLWHNEANKTTIILQERYPILDQGITSYLWSIAQVKTKDLLIVYENIK